MLYVTGVLETVFSCAPDVSSPININSTNLDPIARTVRLEVRYRILVTNSTTGCSTCTPNSLAPATVRYT